MKYIYTLLLAFVGFSAIAKEPNTYDEKFRTLLDASNRSSHSRIGRLYEEKLLNSHNVFWPAVYRRCHASVKNGYIEKFDAVARIDNHGTVTNFYTSPGGEDLQCFVKEMVGKRYPAPPSSPFYQHFVIYILKND